MLLPEVEARRDSAWRAHPPAGARSPRSLDRLRLASRSSYEDQRRSNLRPRRGLRVIPAVSLSLATGARVALDSTSVPRHVAIIMDGNRRWAKERGLPAIEGHRRGMIALRHVTRAASDLGIEVLTVYGFSTQNWNREASRDLAALRALRLLRAQRTDRAATQQRSRPRHWGLGVASGGSARGTRRSSEPDGEQHRAVAQSGGQLQFPRRA